MTRDTIRVWYLVHRWTSLICTLFLLMLCATGLPLIFHDEIDLLSGEPDRVATAGAPSSSDAAGLKPLDTMLAKVLANEPGQVPVFMAFDNETPLMTITTAPRPDSRAADMTIHVLNRATGEMTGRESEEGAMHFLLQLHTDMFLGLPGMLFLGLMGFLFFLSLVSGAVLYAPFMRKLKFGTLRVSRSERLRQMDYHNLLGIVALAWMSVVGLTGVINAAATPLRQMWQMGELAEMTRTYAGQPPLPPSRYGSIDKAMAAVRQERPGNSPQFIGFPGGAFSSKHHYAIFLQGTTKLTEHVLTPALVDAERGVLTDIRQMPWYMVALSYSQPLHFGDYGGLPLKILWAALDLFTLHVLWTGLLLWQGKRRAGTDAHVREVETGGMPVPAE
ncbi:PepSY-associated TM helix domain-containing protein [Sphingobium sp. TKS]|uniref:PepSY-associated TM helix domain-containing protein n=1 Tax=Sphingobium sp. TKS TaxID=1315974 RepID=UPI0007700C2D|nr:PepSY-associated TM helix domain-containing protein [Sphingobium sp. TKS]AMK26217.1 PepSY-associated TM helix domain-containing protein [Sphingobium sp. TKS]